MSLGGVCSVRLFSESQPWWLLESRSVWKCLCICVLGDLSGLLSRKWGPLMNVKVRVGVGIRIGGMGLCRAG